MKKLVCFFVFAVLSLSLFACGPDQSSNQQTIESVKADQARERLEEAIEEYSTLSEADYSPYTWKSLESALQNAERVDGLADARAREIDDAYERLLEAKNDLCPSLESGKYIELDYEACVRNPDKWKGEFVGFAGIVNEVKTDGGTKVLTVAMNGTNETLVRVSYPSDLTEQNVLTGDVLAVFGSVYTVKDGKTLAGTSVTYPVISATYIENQSA